ncbi:DNA-directed DNA polymerase alpha subunit pol12 [Coemansia brasiliensis]|uniref:DNA polymerase alpha subunit B n=1 Tax=Coemansia brasiliensis TaxID=2650707 RepID=A0A9W8IDE0_9FUNG|nr:DNA-directed DNA polymerase alpha subunit pol12 [Coemansia brasiliensis]
MQSTDSTQLQKVFGNNQLEPDAIAECQSICQAFGLAANELFIRWQTFVINRHGGDAGILPTRERMLAVRAMLQQERDRRATQRSTQSSQMVKLTRNKERAQYDKNSVEGLLHNMVTSSQEQHPRTPQSVKRVGLLKSNVSALRGRSMASPMSPSVFAEPSPSAIRYSKRTNMGRVEDVLHPELPPLQLPEPRPSLTVSDLSTKLTEDSSDDENDEDDKETKTPGAPAKRMRFMFEKLGTRTETVNKRIERMALDVKVEYGITALANPTYPHQNEVTAVGRIVNINLDDATAPISSDSLFLETSRRLGNGRRIMLNVQAAPSFSLFPGQVVAVEGKNLKGSEFAVSQFRPLPQLQHIGIDDRPDAIEPFDATVASGPYTLSDNFDYEPLRDLVDHIIAARPSLVLLLGPFVSETHPMLRDGQVDLMPDEIFQTRVAPHLNRLRESLPSCIYLVPSPDDLCLPYVSLPQPALRRDQLARMGLSEGIHSLANPAQISVNGVNIAISNIDTLFHLVKEEVSRLPALSDRLPRLAWHLVEQRHFYPLATPPAGCAGILASQDTMLRMLVAPDILITPSQLRQFARVHENVVLLNPGHSSKGLSGGTFAKLAVRAAKSSESPSTMLGNSTRLFPAEFTSVEIARI